MNNWMATRRSIYAISESEHTSMDEFRRKAKWLFNITILLVFFDAPYFIFSILWNLFAIIVFYLKMDSILVTANKKIYVIFRSHFLSLIYRWIGLELSLFGDDTTLPPDDATIEFSNHPTGLDVLEDILITPTKGIDCLKNGNSRLLATHDKIFGCCYLLNNDKGNGWKKFLEDFAKNPVYDRFSIYVEGGVTSTQKLKSEQYALANNLPVYKHLATPHTKGFTEAILAISKNNSLNPTQGRKIKWVVDKTWFPINLSSTFEWIPTNFDLGKVYVMFQLYNINELPTEEAEIRSWLLERFKEKDEHLERFYSEGILPGPENFRNPVQQYKEIPDSWIFCLFYGGYLTLLSNYIFLPIINSILCAIH